MLGAPQNLTSQMAKKTDERVFVLKSESLRVSSRASSDEVLFMLYLACRTSRQLKTPVVPVSITKRGTSYPLIGIEVVATLREDRRSVAPRRTHDNIKLVVKFQASSATSATLLRRRFPVALPNPRIK